MYYEKKNFTVLKRLLKTYLCPTNAARSQSSYSEQDRAGYHQCMGLENLESRLLMTAQPIITEFSASNSSSVLVDEDNQSSDWIEIFNAGDEPINLEGWHLTDKTDNLDKWTFPAHTLSAGEYLIVFASNKDRAIAGAELHTDFTLDADGEYLALVQPDGVTIVTQFGSATEDYPTQWRDISYGNADSGNTGTQIVGDGQGVTYYAPTDATVDGIWYTPGFDDSSWEQGQTGLGYNLNSPDPDPDPDPDNLISNVTYIYDNFADYNATAGKENFTSPFALTDGLGQADEYTPTAAFWDAGQEGTIYLEDDVNIDAGQPLPGVTFDLGTLTDLEQVQIHYGHHYGAGIIAPLAVEVLLDGNSIGTFNGFDSSLNVSPNGDIRTNTLDLAGYTGQMVTLNFLADSSHPHESNTGWLGLTEVEFFGDESTSNPELSDYNNAVLANNPLLYWTFDETGDTDPASSLVNDSAENTLTPQGAASRAASTQTTGGVSLGRAANIGGAVGAMFSATDLFGDPTPGANNSSPGADFIASQKWAVEFWFNVSANSAQYFSETFDGAGTTNNPGIIYNFNSETFEMYSPGGRTGVANVTPDTWHHAVVAFYGNSGGFGNNLREIYVDGVLTQSTTDTFSAGHGLGNIAIGNAINGSNPIEGMIDEYAIYEIGNVGDFAAQQAHVADIAGHYALAPSGGGAGAATAEPAGALLGSGSVIPPSAYNQAVLEDNPLFYWTFDESSGNAIEQVNGLANDALVPEGSATRIQSTTTASGIDLGLAADIDGSDLTRFFASDLSGTTIGSKWAVEFWTQLDDPLKNSYYLEARDINGNQPGVIHGYTDNVFELFQGNRTGPSGPTTLSDGQWHHVVIGNDTTTGTHTFIIDNGTPITYAGTPGPVSTNFILNQLSVGNIVAGSINGGTDAKIDELALYDLSSSGNYNDAIADLAQHHSAVPQNTDVENAMYENASSLYTRMTFDAPNLGLINQLFLETQFDDGFIAYLNGVKIAEVNAPASPAFDSVATGEVSSSSTSVQINVSEHINLLQSTGNVLAVHGLNLAADDLDFFLSPKLIAFEEFQQSNVESYFLTPTPGAANGSGIEVAGPIITDLSVPEAAIADAQDLVVEATILEDNAAIDTVTLTYRVNYGTEVELVMLDDGLGADTTSDDGIFTAVIPESVSNPGDMLRYFVYATDSAGNDSRFPMYLDPQNSPEYVGTVIANDSVTSDLPVFEWFLQPGTEGAAETRSGTRASVFYLGEFYDNVFVRLRGVSINSTSKKAFKVDFNQHHEFRYDPNEKRVEEFNLNSTGLDKAYIRQVIGAELMRDAGVAYSTTFPMHVRRNGEFFSVGLFNEDPNETYLDRNGLDEDGALYKGDLNGFTLTAQGGYRDVNTGFDKQTRQWEGNSDMVDFVTGLAQNGQDLINFVYDNVDLPSLVNYFAASVILQDADRLVNNFFAYRDTEGTGEWTMLPWDLDLALGQYQVGSDNLHADDDYPSGVSHPFHGIQSKPDFRNPALWNHLLTVIIDTPAFREMYLRRLRTLMDDFLNTSDTPTNERYFETRIEELRNLMAEDVLLDKAKWGTTYGAAQTFDQALDRLINEYLEVRRTHLFETHSIDNLPTPVETIISGTPGDTNVTYFVPTDNSLGLTWTGISFDDSSWQAGTTGIGYEDTPADYASLIQTSVRPQDTPGGSSTYVRIEFNIPDANALTSIQSAPLTLQMKYDDGFVAYINGNEAASTNIDTNKGSFNSTAINHADPESVIYENFTLSSDIINSLVVGTNVLAIQGVNSSDVSSDMLILPQLVSGTPGNLDTAGIPNEQALNPQINIDLNNIVFNPVSADQDEEYIPLINPNNTSVDISGWTLTGGVQYTFKPGTVIPAGATLYVSPDVNTFRARATGPSGNQGLFVQGNYSGHISNLGEQISLIAKDGTTVIHSVVTPTVPTVYQESLRITELHYNPAEPTQGEIDAGFTNENLFEFIELLNISETETLDLTGVEFTDGVDFNFTESDVTSLAPGEMVLVVANVDAFLYRYGTEAADGTPYNIAGAYTGDSLRNSGEDIKLEGPESDTIHDFEYEDGSDPVSEADWHPLTDGDGPSLSILDVTQPEDAWNLGTNWRTSGVDHGTPGRLDPNDGTLPGDANYDGLVNLEDLAKLATNFGSSAVANPGLDVRWLHGDFTGDGIVDLADLARLATFFGQSQLYTGAAAAESTSSIIEAATTDHADTKEALLVNTTSRLSSSPEASWSHINSLLDDEPDETIL